MPATDSYLRNMKTMHIVFCVSAIVFCGSTLLMLYIDHQDEWRKHQRNFYYAESLILENEKGRVFQTQSAGATEFESRRQILIDNLIAQGESLSDVEEYRTLTGEVADLALAFNLKERDVKFKRADRDVARANRDLAVRDALPNEQLRARQKKFDDFQSAVEALEHEWEILGVNLDQKKSALGEITSDRDAIDEELKKFTSEVTRIGDTLDQIAPGGTIKSFKRMTMEWPIIDGFNSHMKVRQDWLPDLEQVLGMTSSARFDRCRTCHLGIDRFGEGNVPVFPHGETDSENVEDWVTDNRFPHPYASHPRPDVYMTAASPHPMAEFGCTTCHEGQGSATSFLNAQHGPNDPAQDREWNKDYGHYHNHFWEYPMYPKRLQEATCLKCHHDVVELGANPQFGATAPKAYEGWQLIRKFGCFGCHEINGFDAGKRIGPDLRLEPTAEEQPKFDADPKLIPGKMRKVGPSLKHIAQKTTEDWIAYWTEEPKRFRPKTRMPQFFIKDQFLRSDGLPDHEGLNLSAVEIRSIAHFLSNQSEDIELDAFPGSNKNVAGSKWTWAGADKYTPDTERGKAFLAERGCLACHSHEAHKGAEQDFGPNLSKTGQKLKKGTPGKQWLYTWIRNPQKHHPRTRMPDLFLDPIETKDADGNVTIVDPAADIAEFLTARMNEGYEVPPVLDGETRKLAQLHLAGKALTNDEFEKFWTTRKYPRPVDQIKGDEIELVYKGEGAPTETEWLTLVRNYLGRRSISRYGCSACHDINGFGEARPIGTALQDWGRKDTSRLAPEHIHEYLHHHGQTDGSSTQEYVEGAIKNAAKDGFDSETDREDGLRNAFFYDSLIHHGRPGFIFQKLRDPRSYDYAKIETKKYTERLVMPKFPLTEVEMESIATFVLGLVAEPPTERYIYQPKPAARDRNQGEILLQKYNCIGCHMTDMHEMTFGFEEGDLSTYQTNPKDHLKAVESFIKWRQPGALHTGRTISVEGSELPVVSVKGLPVLMGDPEELPEDQIFAFELWDAAHVLTPEQLAERQEQLAGGQRTSLFDPSDVIMPAERATFTGTRLIKHQPARTGQFAEWLVNYLMEEKTRGNRPNAWQMSPPPLFREGDKVQTDWLFRFLKDPEQLRHTTVLRMPRFNMSDEEARILANYFAAADDAPYPYQKILEAEPAYLAGKELSFGQSHPERAAANGYLQESWQVLNAPLCIKCHSVGGRSFQIVGNPEGVIRGPNLEYVNQRLRSQWTLMWLYKPQWITPYTSMPAPFAKDAQQFKPLFDGDAEAQTIGVRDALMNYYHLLERHGRDPLQEQQANTN